MKPAGDIKSAEAAALLGISTKSLYRWIAEGRLSYPLMRADIEANRPEVRQRGAVAQPWKGCAICGDCDPAHFTRRPARPSGFDSYCRACYLARKRNSPTYSSKAS